MATTIGLVDTVATEKEKPAFISPEPEQEETEMDEQELEETEPVKRKVKM